MERMVDRFVRSARLWASRWSYEDVYALPPKSLDDLASGGFNLADDRDAVALAGVRLLASHELLRQWSEIHDLLEDCRSPIEVPMALALMTIARHHEVDVAIVDQHGRVHEPVLNPARRLSFSLRIEPQAELGEHRVDFLLTLEATIREESGQRRTASRSMVIECDGHDFHERTKAQARHDRERDRLLQSFGFLVYRYTGQEIWEDVFSCASEALNGLEAPVRAALSPTQPPQ